MTKEKIRFYFNQLHSPLELEYMHFHTRETMRTPVTENDGYFAIEYSNGVFELYTFYEHVHEAGITRKDVYYTLAVTEDGLNVSPGTIYVIPAYGHDEQDEHYLPERTVVGDSEGFFWIKETWNSMQSFWSTGKMIELVLKNNTNENVTFLIYDIFCDGEFNQNGNLELFARSHGEVKYQFPVKMISLSQRIRIIYEFRNNGRLAYPIYLHMMDSYPYGNQMVLNTIQVSINEFGYEIQLINNN
jgi:hypothetical protein